LGNDISSHVFGGQIWQLTGNVQGSSMGSLITYMQFYIDCTIDGLSISFNAMDASGSTPYWQDNYNLLLKSFPVVIPAGRAITLFRPRLVVNVGTAGGGSVFKLGMVSLRLRDVG
jgi:hypothetical protein